jgi:hypothetical protein
MRLAMRWVPAWVVLPLACGTAPARQPEVQREPAVPTVAVTPGPAEVVSSDPRTPAGVAAFVADLCEHAEKADEAWVTAHVALPLVGNEVVNDNGGDPLLGRAAEDVAGLAAAPLCKATVDAAALSGLVTEGDRIGGTVRIGGWDHRLRLELVGVEARLVELSFTLDARQPKGAAPKVEYVLNGRVLSASARDGVPYGAFIDATVRDDPTCIYLHASKYQESGSFFVRAEKTEGSDARARVYASTAVPASLVGCLEGQLDRAMAATFRGVPFQIEYFLMIGIPVSGDAIDENANMIEAR